MTKQEIAEKRLEVFGWMKSKGYDRKASKDISGIIVHYLKDQVINTLEPASSVSSRLESSLGECSEGNKYEIVPYEGVFWINHQVVGSGEPLSQWVESVLNGA
jgi:hypothetical protein